MLQRHLLTDAQVETIGTGVVAVVERVGMLCQNRELRQAARSLGGVVDDEAETVRFPAAVTQALLDQVRREPPPQPFEARTFGRPGLPRVEGQVAQLIYDYGTGERRTGTRADVAEFLKLGEVLHGADGVGHCLLSTDVPPLLEPLEAALLLAEHCSQPQPVFAWNVRQVPYLEEMGQLLGRPHWFGLGATCIAHPFRFDRDVADRYLLGLRRGHGGGLTAMPVAGMTTPLSVAGFVTAAAAEFVVAWLLARAVAPACSLGGSIWAGTIDMRTGEVSYAAFDGMLRGLALNEFLRRWANKEVGVGGGEYADARFPGYQAAWEKAYKAMTIAAFTGRHPSLGQGMLETGKTLCAAQLLLERDLAGGVALLGDVGAVDENALAIDDIVDVMHGASITHFDRDRTLLGFRELGWCPTWLDRSGWRGESTDRAVLDKCQRAYHDLVAQYEPPAVDPGQLAACRAVVERARRELAG